MKKPDRFERVANDTYQRWVNSSVDTQDVVKLLNEEIDKLEQALAEKDWELQQIREHEFQRGYQEAEEKYQQLMEQAFLFAKATISDMITEGTVNKAKAFLKEREANGSH